MSVHIRPRSTKTAGRRFQVRYRRGGRGYKLEHAGVFATMKEAKLRRDLVAGWLAAGRDPRMELRSIAARALDEAMSRTLADVFRAFTASRVDVKPATMRGYDKHWQSLAGTFGRLEPVAVTPGMDTSLLRLRRFTGRQGSWK